MRQMLFVLALASGCVGEATDDVSVAESDQPSFVLLGNIYQNGTKVSFENITRISGFDTTKLAGLTACDPRALYAVEAGSKKLYFSNTYGQSWTFTDSYAKSNEIACDHGQLATLDASGYFWTAKQRSNGTLGTDAEITDGLDVWHMQQQLTTVSRIQGGDGTFYGVKPIPPWGYAVYWASGHSTGQSLTWHGPIATVGASQVTGTGIKLAGNDDLMPSPIAWPRRAFALQPNGTFYVNNSLLANQNSWTFVDSGSERYQVLTAASPNTLYGIQNKNGVLQINRIRIEESSCFDGVDNDSNGLKDAEDLACRKAHADNWCAAHVDGTYCAGRYEPATFLGQSNQNTALVTCEDQAAIKIEPGACTYNIDSPKHDFLPSFEDNIPAAPDTGVYCNVHWDDGSWGLKWTGSDPCGELVNSKPLDLGPKVVRAGLWSTTGANNVFVRCDNGGLAPGGGPGSTPIASAYAAVGHTTNRCIFSISATALPLFGKMMNDELAPARPFVHTISSVDLAQFGWNEPGSSDKIDRLGHDLGVKFEGPEQAYDNQITEGRPLYAPAFGVVVDNGSRDRSLSGMNIQGSAPNQGELYIKYSIGPSDGNYHETFVVYYAHVRKRLVDEGQTVRPGQIVAYVGASGATGGIGHVHTGVFRLSNVNAHTAAQPGLGHQFVFEADAGDGTGNNTGNRLLIDPLGWANGTGFDPWAYLEWDTPSGGPYDFTGLGGWSVNLFKPGSAFLH